MTAPFNEALFWAKINKTSSCWLWTASKSPHGYGWFSIGRKAHRAPRVSWLLHFGPIPQGLFVLHACDTPACVRPDHLWLGTQADNLHDAKLKGRTATGDRNGTRTHPEARARGEKQGRAKLTREEVLEIRKRFAAGGIFQRHLAQEFNINRKTVSTIVNRRTWTHV